MFVPLVSSSPPPPASLAPIRIRARGFQRLESALGNFRTDQPCWADMPEEVERDCCHMGCC